MSSELFIQVTRLETGTKVLVNLEHISLIKPLAGTEGTCLSLIDTSELSVKETFDEVKTRIAGIDGLSVNRLFQ